MTATLTEPVTAALIAEHRAVTRRPLQAPATSAAASPLLPFILSSPAFARTTATLPAAAMVHLGQQIEVYRTVLPGDVVTADLELLGARREPRGVRLAMRCLVRDAAGASIAELVTAVLLVGAEGPEPFGTIPLSGPPAATGPAVQLLAVTHRIPGDMVREYARVSGDDNPIHLEDAAAVAAGFPGVIAHGMSVLAVVCEDVVDRYAGGDPSLVRGIACRFSGPVRPGEPVVTTMDGTADVVTFSCRTGEGIALKGGWVRLGAPEVTR